METVSRFFNQPKKSFFIFGPRGTGKSTWARVQYKHALRIDLLSPEAFRSFSAKPERLREVVGGHPEKKVVIIDEVQKIPALLAVVHQLIEEKAVIQFVLTGSSSRKLKREGTDLLAGRAVVRSLHPFMAAEIGAGFSLTEALKTGLLPLVYNSPNRKDSLRAYAGLYLREEVQAEGLVRNIGSFSRFLEAISFSQGSLLNTSEVARECQTERKTVEGYVQILEDLLLCFRIPVFTRRAKRAVIAHSKFYYFDAGVFRSLRPAGPLDRSEEIDGAALEGLVAQHLRAWIAYGKQGESNKLYFWRSRAGSEVDFVVYGPSGFWAIEVKNSGRVRPEDLRSLRAFGEDYPECKLILLYRGKEKIKQHNILCIPCEEFLIQLRPDHGLDNAFNK